MHNPKIDKEMSRWVAETIDSKPEYYFMNALMGMYLMPEPDKARFCVGFYRYRYSLDIYVIEHAWIEYNGVIIDPTLILNKDIRLIDYIYFGMGCFELEEISEFYFYNIQNSEDFENELDCHSVCASLGKAEKYSSYMERIRALNYICIMPNNNETV